MQKSNRKKYIIGGIIILGLIIIANYFLNRDQMEGFIKSNGRIEVTPLDISTKLPGRVDKILVDEGDYVEEGQLLAIMQLDSLEAQLAEAEAYHQQAQHQADSAKAVIQARESDKVAAEAAVSATESQLYAAERKLNRLQALVKRGATTEQDFDDQEAFTRVLKADVATANSKVLAAQAAIDAAKAQFVAAESQVIAAEATINRVKADIKDANLIAPVTGRIQYRISEPSEVLGAGGKVLNLLDLSKVYMTFFVPTEYTGMLIEGKDDGTEVRIVLDVAPDSPIPARITFVSPEAQFTPKTVETQSERQKLMYRVKAQINPELLDRYQKYIKTGVTGEAYIKVDPNKKWPAFLNGPLIEEANAK
ncbi:HlyD family efflux transporter periplasmic adaptor subunit [Ignatzschineria rhizosphaerae]|uniref:HlyD family efflux transporter periplasmic adaptor subunit n=1 Tax=Ignatzschineria rhizosphaerae TaxID=2923279 RepID=A0ABY3X2X7_9GAMM|nr:HlyD family efflux transporter periplasmic adaptor subunit [Ignatzschineria rhizosphaerae]UNM97226.1 HlyD family efflux transporter periplasmic adaptor subunit [Ignatzschineria rhizosphaerae]